jgi:hypothetical protein
MSNYTDNTTKTTIKQAIDGFLLSCKVEGKSYGTIECHSDKLKGFLWYATGGRLSLHSPGGGYVLAGGCSATETKNPKNFRVFMEAAVEYGTY